MTTPNILNNRYDIVIVGARCAGAATAMLLARAGLRVLVVDRGSEGTDTLSTHALMRTGVAFLQRWGVLTDVIAAGTPPIRQSKFVYGDEVVTVDIKPSIGTHALFAPRRTLLDSLLVEAAREAGGHVGFGVLLQDLSRNSQGRVTGVLLRLADGRTQRVEADLVIGADGRQSTVARLAGSLFTRRSDSRAATIYAYFPGMENQGYRWSYRPGISAGAIPTNDDAHCVFVGMPPSRVREAVKSGGEGALLEGAALCDPELAERIRACRIVSRVRRFSGIPGHLRQAQGAGWALVGDAGYFKDPITAHGMTDAFRDASLLAAAILSDDPNAIGRYQERRDALSIDLFEATNAIASFTWTLDELKAHHAHLKAAMSAEQKSLFPTTEPPRLAA